LRRKGLAKLVIEEHGVADRAQVLGQLERDRIADEMRSATCIVIPSVSAPDGDQDGTPNVLGEAVAAAVPVIASQIAGLEELLLDGRSGLLHEPGDVPGLRACIRRLMNEPDLAVMLAARARSDLQQLLGLPLVAER
jgi:colanic acid/amylovoran biosynthesis glycosyltransferase